MKRNKSVKKKENTGTMSEVETCLATLNNLSTKSKKWLSQSNKLQHAIEQHINATNGRFLISDKEG